MLALAIGTLLAVGALAVVLYPLFADARAVTPALRPTASQTAAASEQEAVVALREIEFDRATGKLSDGDYEELRARYTERALDAMRQGGPAPSVDVVEAAVLAYRTRLKQCSRCGPRPEPDAMYCSDCGRYLAGACEGCGLPVTEPASTFCAGCGRRLAA